MSGKRVILGPFAASGVNLAPSDYVAGIPSPMAALGFVGALLRRTGVQTWTHGVIPVFHAVEPSRGRIKPEPELDTRNPPADRMKPGEIPETITGRVVFSLLAEIPDAARPRNFIRALDGMRFAGGAVFPAPGAARKDTVREVTDAYLADQGAAIRRGWALTPPKGRAAAGAISFGEEDTLATLAETLFPLEKEAGSGWLVAAPVGYRLLETEGRLRKASRSETIPHSFAEPGVGVGELVSIRNPALSRAGRDALAESMWRWSVHPDGCHLMLSDFHRDCL